MNSSAHFRHSSVLAKEEDREFHPDKDPKNLNYSYLNTIKHSEINGPILVIAVIGLDLPEAQNNLLNI